MLVTWLLASMPMRDIDKNPQMVTAQKVTEGFTWAAACLHSRRPSWSLSPSSRAAFRS